MSKLNTKQIFFLSIAVVIFVILAFWYKTQSQHLSLLQSLYNQLQETVNGQQEQISRLNSKLDILTDQAQPDTLPQNTIYLFKNVSPQQATHNIQADIVLKLPDDVRIVADETHEDLFEFIHNENEYQMIINRGGRPFCEFGETLPACGYTDEEIITDKLSTKLRVWERAGSVFALNLPAITIEGYYTRHIVLLKKEPTETFTQQEIDYWKDLLTNNIQVVPAS